MAILELKGLTKLFGRNTAVGDLEMTVEEGQIRGLIGPNGSGKTTIFNLITGFLRPTRGKIFWQGRDITHLPTYRVARLGLVRTFQLTALFKEITALQNVIMSSHMHTGIHLWQQFWFNKKSQRKEKAVEQRALALLDQMGIADIANERAADLPHGHAAALGIANALATNPKIILLDEPVGGMNPTETAQTMERIKAVRDQGITILLVEHDMNAVMSTCDVITCINFGYKIAEGAPQNVCRHPEVVKAYLGEEIDLCLA
ncbi:MAG: ABC transporter ATP-binding protein [Desulfobacterales bacterium]|nr:MAG: ABC transporter ATP-binding protein [Desulfobacterales bacterium]